MKSAQRFKKYPNMHAVSIMQPFKSCSNYNIDIQQKDKIDSHLLEADPKPKVSAGQLRLEVKTTSTFKVCFQLHSVRTASRTD